MLCAFCSTRSFPCTALNYYCLSHRGCVIFCFLLLCACLRLCVLPLNVWVQNSSTGHHHHHHHHNNNHHHHHNNNHHHGSGSQQQSTNTATESGKKEEFRRYLEKSGVLDALVKVLVGLYEEPDRPSNALGYVQRYLGAPPGIDVEGLQRQNETLQRQVEQLQRQLREGGGEPSTTTTMAAAATAGEAKQG